MISEFMQHQYHVNNPNYIYIFSYTLRQTLMLPAFVTSFSDKRTSSWESVNIYGKMDPIYTYKNTTRKISISFDVPCQSLGEGKFYDSLLREDLRKSVYPIYTQRAGENRYSLATPPFHRIRFCNLIKSNRPYSRGGYDPMTNGLLGWIDGYTFSPNVANGFFVEEGSIYAKLYTVSLNLNVIHEHFLGFKRKEGFIVSRDEDNKRFNQAAGDEMATEGFYDPNEILDDTNLVPTSPTAFPSEPESIA